MLYTVGLDHYIYDKDTFIKCNIFMTSMVLVGKQQINYQYQ